MRWGGEALSSSSLLWTEKYAPGAVEEVAGNAEACAEAKRWALDWERGKPQKPLLLHGGTGAGKTALVKALANEMNWHAFFVDYEKIDALPKASGAGLNLLQQRVLFVADDLDSLKAGAINKTAKALLEGAQPTVLVARDVWEPKLAGLRNACKRVEMKGVNWLSVKKRLKEIAAAEGLDAEVDAIARGCGGDLRAAINDLQAFGGGQATRDKQEDVFKCLRRVFKTTDFKDAVTAADNLDRDLDQFILWIEENTPREYEEAGEVAEAFNWLSRGNVFKGRIGKRQNYALLKYVRSLSLAGVALSKKEKYGKFTPYAFPGWLKKMGSTKKKRAVLNSAAGKVGKKIHASKSEVRQMMPLLAVDPGASEYFGLTEEEASVFSEFHELKRDKQKKRKA